MYSKAFATQGGLVSSFYIPRHSVCQCVHVHTCVVMNLVHIRFSPPISGPGSPQAALAPSTPLSPESEYREELKLCLFADGSKGFTAFSFSFPAFSISTIATLKDELRRGLGGSEDPALAILSRSKGSLLTFFRRVVKLSTLRTER